MPVCYRKGYERGLWLEIQTMEDYIKSKESKGQDSRFERELLKSWKKYSERDYDKLAGLHS